MPFNTSVSEIHLTSAPLVRVLAQVKWDELTQFKSGFDRKAEELGEVLESDYPMSSRMQGVQFDVGPAGVAQRQGDPVHRFSSAEDDWRVYFAPTFVTLETSRYETRDLFCDRLEALLSTISEIASIPRAVRLGYRYVNRISKQDDLEALTSLVRPEMLGGRSIPLPSGAVFRHSLSESLFSTNEGSLLAKWATLPANASIDPTIEAVDGPSWVLDLDSFSETRSDFTPSALVNRIKGLSTLGYGFFRWAVTPDFLERFGGTTNVS
jgi:uncharacterized protein (TIGR04255 family)